ncbi:MAG: molybdopterin-dependent oxidoreductase, partial [Dehalococcoidia bacterium]
ALLAGWGPGRSANGEQFHRAAITLAAMTGNIGIHGGNAAGFEGTPLGVLGSRLPTGRSPLLSDPEAKGLRRESLNAYSRIDRTGVRVHTSKLFEAILEGTAGGYPSDIKLLYVAACNPVNQFPHTRKVIEGLKKVDFVVVHEQFMTYTARFADILLPVNTFLEKIDIGEPWMSGPWFVYLDKAIEPLYESKSDWEICRELAPRLGITGYEEKSEEAWLEEFWQATPGMPDFETFRQKGVHKIELAESHVAFKEQIEDPENYPFSTPSGRIEIYSQQLAAMDNPLLPPIPKYVDVWEGPNDPLVAKYPLQLISTHFKTRDHSTFVKVPWLAELEPQRVWLNPIDARARGIGDGDMVRIFNDRGTVVLPARVSGRIMPGVVDIPEGAWYAPDSEGIDRGGSPNVLLRDDISPGGAFASNTCLVQAEKLL